MNRVINVLVHGIRDYSKVDVDKLKKVNGVVGVVDDPGRFQIIIGTNVGDVYDEIIKISDVNEEEQLDVVVEEDMEHTNKSADKDSFFDKFISFVVAIFNPLLPLFAGSGLIRGLTILAVELGWLAEAGTTNALLTVAGTAIFHFLPIVVAASAANRLKVNPYIAAIIMGTLIMPDFVGLVGGEFGSTIDFFGLNVEIFDYSGQVITPIVLVWLQSKIEPFLKEKLPSSLHLVLIATLLITILFPVAILIVGPLSNYVSIGLANIVDYLASWNSILTGAIIGGIWNILILFGVHWAPNTMVIIPEIAQTGESALIAYGANANFGMAGAALAIYLRTKNRDLKAFSMNSIISVFLSGIVEPAIYGLGVPFKTPLIAGSLGAALGGAFMGAFNVVGYTFIFGGLTTIPAFAGPTLIPYMIGLLISFVSGMILTFTFGWNEKEGEGAELYA
jgi:PTS system beta-glucosides-specific IIC component